MNSKCSICDYEGKKEQMNGFSITLETELNGFNLKTKTKNCCYMANCSEDFKELCRFVLSLSFPPSLLFFSIHYS